jgi:hypothetical protein
LIDNDDGKCRIEKLGVVAIDNRGSWHTSKALRMTRMTRRDRIAANDTFTRKMQKIHLPWHLVSVFDRSASIDTTTTE